ncbi:MAG: hypothetical protein J6M24_00695 [Lachnospiraceae bacterium]|nr:hypothetical protein [Lachnospiraceae bacterium]
MKISKQNSTVKKIVFSVLIVVGVLALSYLLYYLKNYTFNKEYKKYLLDVKYETGSEFKALSDTAKPDGLAKDFVLAAKNDKLRLYINLETAEIAVYDEASKKLTFSNPQNTTEADYKNPEYMWNMSSQLILRYFASVGSETTSTMTSYQFCTGVEREPGSETQFKVEAVENGIRVIYEIGDLSNQNYVPTYLREDTYNELYQKLIDSGDTRNAANFMNFYQDKKSKKGFRKIKDTITPFNMMKIDEFLANIGWTEENFVEEMEAADAEYSVPVSFIVPLEYRLENDKLNVTIVTDHIEEHGGATLYYIDVLPFFGAEKYANEGNEYKAYVLTYKDERATDSVAEESESENLIYDNDKLFISSDVGSYSFCTFDIYDADAYYSATEGNKPESLGRWVNVAQDGFEFSPEFDKKYLLTMTEGGRDEPSEELEFIVHNQLELNKGYFLVPNGSGSLIRFNSIDCDGSTDYSEYIYGQDEVMFDADLKTTETESVKLPVYGWYNEAGNSLMVILSRGESFAELHVMTANDISCKEPGAESMTNFNIAYTRYYLRAKTEVAMSTTDKFTVWNDKIFPTELTQKYCFTHNEEAGYSGMANYYRNYLIENGDLVKSEATNEDNIGMYLDIIGAVRGDTTFLGVTRESVIPVTTFKQAEAIVDSFYKNDIRNLIVNYQGWMNGGYYHDTVLDIDVIRKLGGKKKFEDLAKHIENGGGKLYGDMAISRVSFGAKDFHYNLEAARLYGSGVTAAYGKTSPTSYSNSATLGYKANLYDILSPKFYEKYVTKALKEMKKIDISGISLRDLGTYLNCDLKKTGIVNREQTKEITEAMLKKFADDKKSVMLNSALGFALAYADDIINAPIGDNNYVYVDYEVPFYEMVIHGYINYAGYPINLSADTTTVENILECIEYGASPHFTLSYKDATTMKYTSINNLYATNYVNWVDEACDIYREVNNALAPVTKASVIRHDILDGNNKIKKITYDNGVVIYVNYSDDSVATSDGTIGPKNYMVVK